MVRAGFIVLVHLGLWRGRNQTMANRSQSGHTIDIIYNTGTVPVPVDPKGHLY
jgi:hypothetical protein